jgi:peptide/nickel transport system substrate-binding protein
MKHSQALTALLLLFLAAGCAGITERSPNPTPLQPNGGTLRIVLPGDQEPWGRFVSPDGDPLTLDPHLDLYSPYDTWELLRCCLTRQLLSNNGRSTADGGARIHPDVAASLPTISEDGLTWTFTLRQDLTYAPPMEDVPITAPDFIRSFHRLLAPRFAADSLAAGLYLDIVGAQAYLDGEAASIAGLESPNDHTLVIRLARPAGDFGPRIALPIVPPIPPSPTDPLAPFGAAEGHDDGYGRFLVASGPYMVEGAAELDFSLPPDQRQPLAGLELSRGITLVRNPSWDPAFDTLRAARPDRILIEIVPTLEGAIDEVANARADLMLNFGAVVQVPADTVAAVRADRNLGTIHIDESDFVAGILMNLAVPPFDDLQVRKAAAFAIDKARMVEVMGGPLTLRVAHHMVPDAMQDNLLVDYRPYPSDGDAGDIEAAHAEMRRSAYDSDGDGVCDAPVCSEVAALTRDLEPFPALAESVRDDLAEIGIHLDLDVVPFNDFFDIYADPSQHYAMYVPLAWAKDALSPASFFVGQFYSPVALAGQGNGSLVGATAEQLAEWGYGVTDVPNVDAHIEACLPLTGNAQFECWAGLDQHMMENVLPSVSFGAGVGVVHASRRVAQYDWDQLVGAPSFDRITFGSP